MHADCSILILVQRVCSTPTYKDSGLVCAPRACSLHKIVMLSGLQAGDGLFCYRAFL